MIKRKLVIQSKIEEHKKLNNRYFDYPIHFPFFKIAFLQELI